MPRTTVLPNAHLIDADLNRTAKMAKIQAKALENQGACTKIFVQGGTPNEAKGKTQMAQLGVGKYYKPQGMHGVCKAMSTFWMANHANDEDFWGWLIQDGFVKVSSAAMLIDAHKQSKANGNQTLWENNILKTVGIILQGHSNAMIFEDVDTGATPYGRAVQMVNRILKGRWGYRSISIHREGGGHAMAAWVGQDVCFMDPNYGEFWFETVDGFRNWFIDFWVTSGYATKYDVDCQVLSYGKSINSVRGRNHWM